MRVHIHDMVVVLHSNIMPADMSWTSIFMLQGRGVVGVAESGLAEEVKNSPALSLTLAYLPKVWWVISGLGMISVHCAFLSQSESHDATPLLT